MRTKILVFLAIVALVLICCQEKEAESEKVSEKPGVDEMTFKGPGVEWLQTKVDEPYTMEELKGVFEKRNLELAAFFQNGEFDEIGGRYGDRGWIAKHTGKGYAHGKKEISEYFAALSGQASLKKFISTEIIINFDKHLWDNPSENPDEDKVYPILERIKIIVDIPNHSEVEIDSMASWEHSRKTWK